MTGEQVLELKMTPGVKALAAKPAHLSSIPGPTRGVESNNHICMLSSYLQIHCTHGHVHVYTLTRRHTMHTYLYKMQTHLYTMHTH